VKLLASARRLRPTRPWASAAEALSAENDATPPDSLPSRPSATGRTSLADPGGNALRIAYPGRRLIFRGARRVLRERLPDDMPAPWEALESAGALAADGVDWAQGWITNGRQPPGWLGTPISQPAESAPGAGTPPGPAPSPNRSATSAPSGSSAPRLPASLLFSKRCCGAARSSLQDGDKTALGYASLELHQAIMQAEVKRGTVSAAAALQMPGRVPRHGEWEHFDELDLIPGHP